MTSAFRRSHPISCSGVYVTGRMDAASGLATSCSPAAYALEDQQRCSDDHQTQHYEVYVPFVGAEDERTEPAHYEYDQNDDVEPAPFRNSRRYHAVLMY